jgi:hypothetical protein
MKATISIGSRVAMSLQRFGTINILYTIGEEYVVDGSHISILAPIIGGEDYYCRKSFHSALLQGIINIKIIYWDYKFRWSR